MSEAILNDLITPRTLMNGRVSWPLMSDAITMQDRMALAWFTLTTERFTSGAQVRAFEQEWSRWLGAEASLFVSSGSTANFLVIASLIERYGLKAGDKVLVPAVTWITNVAPVMQLGLQPVFCDIELETFTFDEEALAQVVRQHPDIKVAFLTHALGFPAGPALVRRHIPEALVVDDICESHGATLGGKRVGSQSLGATFSFYYGHHMTTVEGGMVSTCDMEFYELLRAKRSHGFLREISNPDRRRRLTSEYPDVDTKFFFATDGYNFRNTEWAAFLGRRQLRRLDRSVEIRRRNFAEFLQILMEYDEYFSIPGSEGNSSFCLPFIAKAPAHAAGLRAALEERGAETRPVISGNLVRHPFLRESRFAVDPGGFPNAERLHFNGFYLGNSQFVGVRQLEALRAVLASGTWKSG